MKTLIIVGAMLALSACSPCEPTDYYVGPVCVDDRALTEAERAEVRSAIAPAILLGIAWWTVSPAELAGMRVVFSEIHITSTEGSTITLFRRADQTDAAPCGEHLVRGLPHEIGHVALLQRAPWTGDGNHHDDRWDDEDEILDTLYSLNPQCPR